MKLKGLAAVTAAVTAMTVTAVGASAEKIGTAGIYLADNDWLVQYWGGDTDASGNSGVKSVENAEITGNGDYSAYIELDYGVEGLSFAALCTDIESKSCPAEMTVEIKSVEVNGAKVDFAVNGTPQFKEDGGFMRINIYNRWSDDAADTAVDVSVFDGAERIKVDFTVGGFAEAPAETEAAPAETEPVTEAVTEAPAETEAVTEAPAEEEPAAEEEAEAEEPENPENPAETGNSGALLLTALAASLAAVAVLSKGKKS